MNSSGPGLFSAGAFMITDSIPLLLLVLSCFLFPNKPVCVGHGTAAPLELPPSPHLFSVAPVILDYASPHQCFNIRDGSWSVQQPPDFQNMGFRLHSSLPLRDRALNCVILCLQDPRSLGAAASCPAFCCSQGPPDS